MEEIRQLVLKEILGIISAAERERLLELEHDKGTKRIRDVIRMELNNEEVREYFERNNPDHFALVVIERIQEMRRERRVRAWRRGAIAAVVVSLIAGMGWLYRGKEAAPMAAGNVQLVLPGGERVDVEKGNVQVEGVQFRNDSKRMSYEAVGMTNQYAVLNVPAGKDYTITLSDGTVVQLNAASQLRFPLNFGDQSREVYIEGEGYVEVAKDAKRPFTVHLPGTDVQVLGTAFNVNTYSNNTAKVALVEGVVRLVSRRDSLLLKPGELAVAEGGIKVSKYDTYETLSWREGKFVMNNARMEEVCKVIPRLFGVVMKMDNVAVREKRFSGVIDRNKPVEELMKGLKATNGVDYYWEENVIHIK